MALSIHTDDFQKLFDSAIAAGYRCIAPVRDEDISLYRAVKNTADIALDQIIATKSPKEYFLAEHEVILTYQLESEGKVNIEDPAEEEISRPTLIFGVRPCDAAAGPIVNEIMTWDCDDSFFIKRREAAVVVAIACVEADEACFCTSVDASPDGTEGADILLVPSSDKTGESQEYLVTPVTDKGKNFIQSTEGWGKKNPKQSSAVDDLKKKLVKRFDAQKVREWLETGFDDPFWQTATLSCLGCGTCTYLCPTCHCFDIVDEGDLNSGRRVKNWDSCQLCFFTMHASGHNPRATQIERYRQRIMHKFKYYPDMFDRILCTGCGRCQRSCPVDMALLGLMEHIDQLACEPAIT